MDTISVGAGAAQEELFQRGWTDGLPVIPPTRQRVDVGLEALGLEPATVLGTVGDRTLTADRLVSNAVMAGCRTEHLTVVAAAVDAMLDPGFNVETVVSSTGGAALCLVVSGPISAAVGMNAGPAALGPGNRANATIGRALRLIARNVLGARPGERDGTSIGHPGQYTLVVVESPPPSGWSTLREALGHAPSETTVTLLGTEGPRQIGNHLSADPDALVATIATAMADPARFAVGKAGQGVVVLGPEHAAAFARAGWDRSRVGDALAMASRVSPEALRRAGVVLEDDQLDLRGDDGLLPVVESRADLLLVTAGGAGPGWSAFLPAWAPKRHSGSAVVTRRVDTPHAPDHLPAQQGGSVAEIVIPVVAEPTPELVQPAPRDEVASGSALALIDNSKPGAARFLRYLGEALSEHLRAIGEIELVTKPTSARPLDATTTGSVAARSRLVISGVGD
ncbi:MAG: hypothetical protein KY469_14335 [Actinobacteria bacterium]|nr:hypothetical protein [Actinomycetota bacterium]